MKSTRLFLQIAVAFLLASCGCGGNEETIRAMRALPTERFAALYDYVRSVDASRKDAGGPVIFSFPKNPVPAEIADLNPKYFEVYGGMSRIHLSGCVDDKVYLFFPGLDSPGEKQEIVMSLGESKGVQTLWSE